MKNKYLYLVLLYSVVSLYFSSFSFAADLIIKVKDDQGTGISSDVFFSNNKESVGKTDIDGGCGCNIMLFILLYAHLLNPILTNFSPCLIPPI